MKICELELRQIGPFKGDVLSFDRGEHGLHLVYGPNEGGKSSSLRALVQWLFGMVGAASSRDAFAHPYKDLRVGGTIQSHDGRRLTCIRRPGGKTSLREANDRTQLNPDVLSEFLGGLGKDEFVTKFAIGLDDLVHGGRMIAAGEGDVGETLFAAGAGLATVQTVGRELDARCDELFKPSTAVKPLINAAISDYASARREVRDLSVRSKDWNERSEELERLRGEKEKLDADDLQMRTRRDRLQRIHDALPAIGRWRDETEQLESMSTVPRLRDDFTAARVETMASMAAAQSVIKSAGDELAALREKQRTLGEPPAILRHESLIEEWFGGLKLYRDWVQSSPLLLSDQKRLRHSAQAKLKTLGNDVDLDQADGLRIGPAIRAKIHELAQTRSGLTTALSQAEAELRRRDREWENAQAKLESMGEVPDAGALRKAIQAVQKLGDIDTEIDRKAKLLQEAEAKADAALARLPRWRGTIEALESTPVVLPESIAKYAAELERFDRDLGKIDDEIQKHRADLAAGQERLQAIRIGADVPTEDELSQARAERESAWRRIVLYLDDPSSIDDDVDSGADVSIESMVASFQSWVDRCDELADRLRREATQVSEKAQLIASNRRLDEWIDAAEQRRGEWASAQSQCQERWREAWTETGIEPDSPAEMKAWIGQHAALVQMAENLRQQRGQWDDEVKRRAEHRAMLATHWKDAPDEQAIAPVLDACTEQLDQIVCQATAIEQSRRDVQRLADEKEQAGAAHAKAVLDQANWQTQWDRAMETIGGAASQSPGQAKAVLETIDSLIQDIDEAQKCGDQWKAQRERIDAFDADVRKLVSTLSIDPGDASTEQIVANLYDRLKLAREQKTMTDHLAEQIETEAKRHRQADAQIEALNKTLKGLCEEAGVESAGQLAAAELAAADRRAAEQALTQTESELRAQAKGADIESFIEAALGEDADSLLPQIEKLDEQCKQLAEDRTRLSETIGAKQNELDAIDGSDKAAMANQRAEEAIARARASAEQYVQSKLGSVMLRRAVARYRRLNQDPILRRAGDLFSRFTLGRFDGLDTDATDDGRSVLVGRRDDKMVAIDAMSEGTCDQLFLALRLASLERYLDKHSPIPFVVDDILLKFDDERSAATLSALGELSTRTQVILFTHHKHLIDVARRAVSPDRLFVQSLDDSINVGSVRRTDGASNVPDAESDANVSVTESSPPGLSQAESLQAESSPGKPAGNRKGARKPKGAAKPKESTGDGPTARQSPRELF